MRKRSLRVFGAPVDTDRTAPAPDESRGLRRFEAGAVFGLAGGVTGLVAPASVSLLAFYNPTDIAISDPIPIELTGILVLAGAVLLAVSLMFYRFGFAALRKLDRWFYTASGLCIVGSIGLFLIVLPLAIALPSTPSLVQCIRGAPSQPLSCLRTVQPLSAYSVLTGFWLAWLGGFGIVVGLELGGRRYREARLIAGGATYALLLLVLVDPFVALLIPFGAWRYPLLAIPLLALLAPALVHAGSRRALGR
jgi:hypothetical protein